MIGTRRGGGGGVCTALRVGSNVNRFGGVEVRVQVEEASKCILIQIFFGNILPPNKLITFTYHIGC